MGNKNKHCSWLSINSSTGQVTVLPQELYRHLKDSKKLYVTDKGGIVTFCDGIYTRLSMQLLKAFIKDNLPIELRQKRHWEAVLEEFKTDFPDIREADFNDNERYVVLNNGVLDMKTGNVEAYSEKYLYTRKINANYLPGKNLEDAPVFRQFLDDMLPDGHLTWTFLLEFIGIVLSNVKGWRFKKMLMLVGPGNTGKSKLRELVISLIGEENSASIDLKKLNERFGTSVVYGKRLAGSGDMSYMQISEMDIVKELVGGDQLLCEFKGKNAFQFRYDGLIWCNANKLPYFRGDRGEHVYERFCIVECGTVISEEKRDPQLLDKLLQEKDVIVSIALDHAREAIKRGYRFTESEDMTIAREQYVIENISLLTFVKELCTMDGGPTIRAEFNKIYRVWCAENNVQPERLRDIGKQLAAIGITAYKSRGIFHYPLSIDDDFTNYALNDKKYY